MRPFYFMGGYLLNYFSRVYSYLPIITLMHQVVLELSGSRKVHVISEHATKEESLDKYIKLVEANNNSPITTKGKYSIRKKTE